MLEAYKKEDGLFQLVDSSVQISICAIAVDTENYPVSHANKYFIRGHLVEPLQLLSWVHTVCPVPVR